MVLLANTVCSHYMTALRQSIPADKYVFKHVILKYIFTSLYFTDMSYANVLTYRMNKMNEMYVTL